MKNKTIVLQASAFKYNEQTGIFECYGNVKGNVDRARDKTMNGAYVKSIARHKASGTMPKMYYMHDDQSLPVGTWLDMREDDHGLWMQGKLAKTSMGRDIEILAKDGEITSFSIGYHEIKSNRNLQGINELEEVDLVEVSWVNDHMACNQESRLTNIKNCLEDGELPTKRELQKFLSDNGLSKRESEKIVNRYDPAPDIFELMAEVS